MRRRKRLGAQQRKRRVSRVGVFRRPRQDQSRVSSAVRISFIEPDVGIPPARDGDEGRQEGRR